MVAIRTAFDVPAQRRGAALDDGAECLPLYGIRAVLPEELVAVRAEDLGRLQPRAGHASLGGSAAGGFAAAA